MNKKLPILILIPHGGYRIPQELKGYENLDDFDCFMNADTCANDIFDIKGTVIAVINTLTSRLFVDVNRPLTAVPPAVIDGVIKTETSGGSKIYRNDYFPDDLAMSNILHRYYMPFHDTVEKIIKTNEIKLILECHTMMAVGPKISHDPGMPRPIISMNNIIYSKNRLMRTCSDELTEILGGILKKTFSNEKDTVADIIKINDKTSGCYLQKKYGNRNIPMIRLSISKSLFLNDKYFSFDYLKVDELRIKEIKNRLVNCFVKFFNKNFTTTQ